MRYFLFLFIGLFAFTDVYSQGCCSGGSGSPIAGGYSQGVLREKQVEFAANFRYSSSSKYFVGDKDTTIQLPDELSSQYLYLRAGFGITKNLTMELSLGYYFDKRLSALNQEAQANTREDLYSSGVSDLLIFPRYDIYYNSSATKKVEVTFGLGYKIPLGSHNDSLLVYDNPDPEADDIYSILPPTVQPSNGSQDIMLYLFGLRGFPMKNLNIFANALYIKKGYNSVGQKFGDYGSVAVFASKTFFRKLGVTVQLRGEWIGKMEYAQNVDVWSFYSYEPHNTGSKKLFFIPQLSYTFKQVTFYGLAEVPLYQNVNGVQVGSDLNVTFGISYRFSKFCDEATLLNEPIKSIN